MTRPVLLTIILLALMVPVYSAHGAETFVSTCGEVLDAPGKYSLSADLPACPGFAIVIAASGVTLNLGGHEVTCERLDGRVDVGIVAVGVSGIHIRNGRITRCDLGIQLLSVQESKINDVYVYGSVRDPALNSGGAGIALGGSDANTLVGIHSTENVIGIVVFNSDDNRVSGNVANGNTRPDPSSFGQGIAIIGSSSDNIVTGNESRYNSDAGIVVANGASHNTVRGNEVSHNDFYGIGIFTRIDLGAPTPVNNLIQGNSSLANGRADVLEVLFDPSADPRETIDECTNSWKDNTFVSQIGPPVCIE